MTRDRAAYAAARRDGDVAGCLRLTAQRLADIDRAPTVKAPWRVELDAHHPGASVPSTQPGWPGALLTTVSGTSDDADAAALGRNLLRPLAAVLDLWAGMVRLEPDLINRFSGPEMLAVCDAVMRCDHQWIDVTNEHFANPGVWCTRCGAIRAGTVADQEQEVP